MSTEATGDGKPPLDPAQARNDPAASAANAKSGDADEPDEGYEQYEEYEQYEQYAEHEDYEADEPQRARRWPRVLLALGFVVLAIVIIGGAVALVGSLTHGFKKPVKVTYKASPVFSLKTGDCFDPQGQQSYTLVACGTPHQAEVFATFARNIDRLKGLLAGVVADLPEAGTGCACASWADGIELPYKIPGGAE